MANEAGINDWNKEEAIAFIKQKQTKLIVTSNPNTIHYASFGLIKMSEEMGEWAGDAAIKILSGTKPSAIPLGKNKRFELILNPDLMNLSKVKLDPELMKKSEAFEVGAVSRSL